MASAAYARIDALARHLRYRGDERTVEQLRADLLLGRDPGVTVPAAAAMAHLRMPASTALTITDHGCELEGYGPVPAPIARDIMADPDSIGRKVITDAGRVVTGIGARKYRPNHALRDLIAARDRECTAPQCHRPARRCDFDHLTPFARGGPASHLNGGPKCARHHHLRDEPGWTVDYDPATGTGSVTTPTSRTYTTQ
ncbi:HNH endonuclease [Amycolatopsis alkalitolerans]|uniref:HNH endonuclease n=1 Tax=Amycolatopsis alkalitolerans TaxID=2547244 RepID=A0A5C4M857_9PSEU|nr:HNH endonuclease [Amycolatopsis alkalitolerans]TNC29657.1 HNH endonuclease [Amycolatopsis alkalitolerans]